MPEDGTPPTADGHIAGGAAYGFVPVSGLFVETFKLRPRPDENFEYREFGMQVEMFDKRIVVAAAEPLNLLLGVGYVHSYSRNGSTVTPLGIATGFTQSTASGWRISGCSSALRSRVAAAVSGSASEKRTSST